ncbi:hypothetical protein GCM10023149_31280 [Mucilaginibacter gynuensis]|uniref:Carboxypeptidase-like protein n=2 Tax=Mucilaginibacter gynuensis TaxID=1302236 RepID=A0ABP8GNP2_9SPHI
MKAEVACNTTIDGVFSLQSPKVDLSDTLWVSCDGYQPAKVPINQFVNNWVISLQKNTLKKRPKSQIKTNNKVELNNLSNERLRHFTGIERWLEPFNYIQLAQKFNAPSVNSKLKKITVQLYISLYQPMHDSCMFRVHVYDMDKSTEGPGAELTEEGILVKSYARINVKVNIPDIHISGKNFFVSIEWLRIPFNRADIQNEIYVPRDRGSFKNKMFKPIIGMSNKKGEFINTWAMNFKHEWQLYTYFVPYLTDFAISAEVEY